MKQYLRRATASFGGALLMLLFVASCEETGPPVISQIRGDTTVAAGDTSSYECLAWDWGLGPISCRWAVSRGRVLPDTAFKVLWSAPSTSGPALIRATVTDEDGFETADSLRVRVLRDTCLFLDEQGLVKPWSYRRWGRDFGAGGELHGRARDPDSSLLLLVLSERGYESWEAGQPCEPIVSVIADTFSAFLEEAGCYYMVLDNRNGSVDVVYTIRAWEVSP